MTDANLEATEYAARLRTVQAAMSRRGLDGLLIADPANLYYLTGYNAWSFYTPQVLLLTADGSMTLFSRQMDAAGAFRTAILNEQQVVGYPDPLVHRPDTHPFVWVAETIRARGLLPEGRVVLGAETDSHFYSPRGHRHLVEGLTPAQIVDAHELVNWVRAVKSPAELTMMRRAATVTTRAMDAAVQTIGVGVPQNVVAAEIMRAQALGEGETWGDYPAIVPLLPTSESADTPHLTWTDRRFVQGDAVVVELAGAYRRYHVPLARTVTLGEPSRELAALESPVAEGLEAVLALVRPGARTGDLAAVWNETTARHGLSKPSRLGYSIGIGFPPDWGERTISIRSGDETVLAAGMTLHVICGMWMTGYGYELSEPIEVTTDGVRTFTQTGRGLVRR